LRSAAWSLPPAGVECRCRASVAGPRKARLHAVRCIRRRARGACPAVQRGPIRGVSATACSASEGSVRALSKTIHRQQSSRPPLVVGSSDSVFWSTCRSVESGACRGGAEPARTGGPQTWRNAPSASRNSAGLVGKQPKQEGGSLRSRRIGTLPAWKRMTTCRWGDVVLVRFPYSDLSRFRKRPALVVQDEQVETGLSQRLVCQITSNLTRCGVTRVLVRKEAPAGVRWDCAPTG